MVFNSNHTSLGIVMKLFLTQNGAINVLFALPSGAMIQRSGTVKLGRVYHSSDHPLYYHWNIYNDSFTPVVINKPENFTNELAYGLPGYLMVCVTTSGYMYHDVWLEAKCHFRTTLLAMAWNLPFFLNSHESYYNDYSFDNMFLILIKPFILKER